MTYYISRGTVVLSPQYTQNDNECATQYGIELVIDGVDEPLTVDQEAYLMLDPANGELTIDTSNFALEDTTLTVKLFLESINSTEDPGQFGIYTFDLTFDDLCNQDTITPTSVDITDMIYYIGRGTITLSPLYEQSDILCAVQYGILLVDDGIDTALTPAQEAFLMLNQANGELTIDNSDFTMDDVVLTVKLYMESTASTVTDVPGQIGTYIFEITFDDQCSQDTITPTSIDIIDLTYEIGEGSVVRTPEYTQLDPLCAAQYGIVLVVEGLDTALTPEQEVFLSLNTADGVLTIDSDDQTLHGLFISVKLYLESLASIQPERIGSYTFDVIFNFECATDVITETSTISDTVYFISRGPEVLQPQYSQLLAQCPSQYGISLVINGVDEPLTVDQEAYLMLNPVNGDLTINTSDFALENTTLTVKLFLESSSSQEDPGQFGIYIFDLIFNDLCNQDTITPTSVDIIDMIYYIGRGTITLSPLYEQSDILCAVQYGILLIDGGIDTALTPAQEAFLMLNQANGELTINNSDFTMDDVVLTVKLYMESTASTVTDVPGQIGIYIFEITFDDQCSQDTITPTSIDIIDFTYEIGEGSVVRTPEYTQLDSLCSTQYGIVLVVEGVDTALTPEQEVFISMNPADGVLTINTDDYLLHGQVFTVKLFQESLASEDAERIGAYTFDITFNDQCTSDTVDSTLVLADITYYIQSEPEVLMPTYTQSIQDCPSRYDIVIVDSGTETALTTLQQASLTLDMVNGALTIDTSDFALDNVTWTIRLYFESENSGQLVDNTFDVTFRDQCWDATLIAVTFLQSSYATDVNVSFQLAFNEMESVEQGLGCGDYTYELEYVGGPLVAPDLSSLLTLVRGASSYLEGTATQTWYGTHSLRIKCTLGTLDTNNPRGNNGLYASLYSNTIELVVNNPCGDPVFSSIFDATLDITDMFIPLGQESLEQDFKGPTDTISVEQGNGSNKCGAMTYEITDDNNSLVSLNRLTFSVIHNRPVEQDDLHLVLESDQSGEEILRDVFLHVFLSNHPTAGDQYYPFSLKWRECIPRLFIAPQIETMTIAIGDDAIIINYSGFDQFPCSYQQTFEAFVIDDNRRILKQNILPNWISQDRDLGILTIDPDPSLDSLTVGRYTILIRSMIDNSRLSTVETQFDITLLPAEGGYTIDEVEIIIDIPDFDVTDDDFSFTITDDNVRVVGDAAEFFDLTIQVYMGAAAQFSTFDTRTNTFEVQSEKLRHELNGLYQVDVVATLSDRFSDRTKVYVSNYFLTIDVPRPEDSPLCSQGYVVERSCNEDRIFQCELNRRLPCGCCIKAIDCSLAAFGGDSYDTAAPLPYIASMSDTGLVQIKWDREMESPSGDLQTAIREPIELSAFTLTQLRHLANEVEEAIQVEMVPKDQLPGEDDIEFTWDLTDYSGEALWIQLNFHNPQQVSVDGKIDVLKITFWDTSYFKSKDGVQCPCGTVISQGVFRQMNQEQADLIDNLDWIQGGAVGLTLVSTLSFELLPTWMFINTGSLLSHTSMMNVDMPGNSSRFLVKWLDFFRMNWWNVNENAAREAGIQQEQNKGDTHLDGILERAGYTHFVALNLVILIAISIVLLGVWQIFAIKDCIGSWTVNHRLRFLRSRHEPMATNFALRLFYELFLEICICIMIALFFVDLSSFSSEFNWVIAIVVSVSICMLIIGLFTFFCWNGPYQPGYLKEGSAWSTIFGVKADEDETDKYAPRKYNKERATDDELRRISRRAWLRDMDDTMSSKRVENTLAARGLSWQWPWTKQEQQIAPIRPDQRRDSQLESIPSVGESSGRSSDTDGENPPTGRADPGDRDIVLLTGHLRQAPTKTAPEPADAPCLTPGDDEGGLLLLFPASTTRGEPDHSSSRSPGPGTGTHRGYGSAKAQYFEGGEGDALFSTLPTATQETHRSSARGFLLTGGARSSWPGGVGPAATQERLLTGRSEKQEPASTVPPHALSLNERLKDALNVKYYEKYQAEAERNVAFETALYKARHPRLKTLYTGLKMNHPRRVALVHPLAFLLRRILFAAIIVFMANLTVHCIFGVFLLMLTCVFMLGYVLHEWQWQSNLISYQHIGNEIGLYFVCMLLLMFTGYCSPAAIWALGWVLISIVIALVVFNLVLMFIYCRRHFKLMAMRCQSRRRARSHWKRANNAITAMNRMKLIAHRDEDHPIQSIQLMHEDDYDLHRWRYLRAEKKRKADLQPWERSDYEEEEEKGPLAFAGAASSAPAFYPGHKNDAALFAGEAARELQRREAARPRSAPLPICKYPFRRTSRVTVKSSQSTFMTLTEGSGDLLRMGASIGPTSDLRRRLMRQLGEESSRGTSAHSRLSSDYSDSHGRSCQGGSGDGRHIHRTPFSQSRGSSKYIDGHAKARPYSPSSMDFSTDHCQASRARRYPGVPSETIATGFTRQMAATAAQSDHASPMSSDVESDHVEQNDKKVCSCGKKGDHAPTLGNQKANGKINVNAANNDTNSIREDTSSASGMSSDNSTVHMPKTGNRTPASRATEPQDACPCSSVKRSPRATIRQNSDPDSFQGYIQQQRKSSVKSQQIARRGDSLEGKALSLKLGLERDHKAEIVSDLDASGLSENRYSGSIASQNVAKSNQMHRSTFVGQRNKKYLEVDLEPIRDLDSARELSNFPRQDTFKSMMMSKTKLNNQEIKDDTYPMELTDSATFSDSSGEQQFDIDRRSGVNPVLRKSVRKMASVMSNKQHMDVNEEVQAEQKRPNLNGRINDFGTPTSSIEPLNLPNRQSIHRASFVGKRDIIMEYMQGTAQPLDQSQQSQTSIRPKPTKKLSSSRTIVQEQFIQEEVEDRSHFGDESKISRQTSNEKEAVPEHQAKEKKRKSPKELPDLGKLISILPRLPSQYIKNLEKAKDIGNMRIEIIEADLITKYPWSSTKDPYCVCETQELHIRTRSQQLKPGADAQKPKWGQFFDINVKTIEDGMLIAVYDEDMEEQDVIGGTVIKADLLCNEKGFDEWVEIKYKKKPAGKVHIRVQFTKFAEPELFKPPMLVEKRKTISIKSVSNEPTLFTVDENSSPQNNNLATKPDDFETVLEMIQQESPMVIDEEDKYMQACLLQRHLRGWKARQDLQGKQLGASVIQKRFREYQRKRNEAKDKKERDSIIAIQNAIRVKLAKDEVKKRSDAKTLAVNQEKAVVVMQKNVRRKQSQALARQLTVKKDACVSGLKKIDKIVKQRNFNKWKEADQAKKQADQAKTVMINLQKQQSKELLVKKLEADLESDQARFASANRIQEKQDVLGLPIAKDKLNTSMRSNRSAQSNRSKNAMRETKQSKKTAGTEWIKPQASEFTSQYNALSAQKLAENSRNVTPIREEKKVAVLPGTELNSDTSENSEIDPKNMQDDFKKLMKEVEEDQQSMNKPQKVIEIESASPDDNSRLPQSIERNQNPKFTLVPTIEGTRPKGQNTFAEALMAREASGEKPPDIKRGRTSLQSMDQIAPRTDGRNTEGRNDRFRTSFATEVRKRDDSEASSQAEEWKKLSERKPQSMFTKTPQSSRNHLDTYLQGNKVVKTEEDGALSARVQSNTPISMNTGNNQRMVERRVSLKDTLKEVKELRSSLMQNFVQDKISEGFDSEEDDDVVAIDDINQNRNRGLPRSIMHSKSNMNLHKQMSKLPVPDGMGKVVSSSLSPYRQKTSQGLITMAVGSAVGDHLFVRHCIAHEHAKDCNHNEKRTSSDGREEWDHEFHKERALDPPQIKKENSRPNPRKLGSTVLSKKQTLTAVKQKSKPYSQVKAKKPNYVFTPGQYIKTPKGQSKSPSIFDKNKVTGKNADQERRSIQTERGPREEPKQGVKQGWESSRLSQRENSLRNSGLRQLDSTSQERSDNHLQRKSSASVENLQNNLMGFSGSRNNEGNERQFTTPAKKF